MRLTLIAAAFGLALAAPAAAQTSQAQAAPAAAPAPAADPADVQSIDGIMAALYDVISGDAGVERDWDRFRSLFHAQAKLIPSGVTPAGEGRISYLTPEDYITRAGPGLVRDGFHEMEIARKTDQFGRIAHVFTTYAAKRSQADAQPFLRGINSVQLWNDGTRWWILSVYWQAEDANTPLPPQYLPQG